MFSEMHFITSVMLRAQNDAELLIERTSRHEKAWIKQRSSMSQAENGYVGQAARGRNTIVVFLQHLKEESRLWPLNMR